MMHMNDDDIPQAARAYAFECDCGCGIVSVRLFDTDDEPMAEIVLEPGNGSISFVACRKKLLHL
jgi:hypothetical protein